MTDEPRTRHPGWHVVVRTLTKAWDDSIFAQSAQAGFWCLLSLPPLLLGLLGSLSYIAPLFGPTTLATIQERLISAADHFFSPSVVNEIIAPTITDIVQDARGEVVSFGFVISLWAGSSAISSFVDSVVEAHDQTPLRHPVRQRFFSLFLYVVMLGLAVVVMPVIALGPQKIADLIPDSWDSVWQFGYYPVLAGTLILIVTALYRVALPRPLPSYRLVLGAALASTVFLIASLGLRVYLTWITSTGYTYGALATPIAFSLFAFFLGFAVVIGAELNAAIEEQWPAPAPYAHRVGRWLRRRTTDPGRAANRAPEAEPVSPS
ncbi:YihY/virulence factor BrkB family protein [Mycobacterium sp. MYCO198283]|uniref:YihY/virulence factor BrkB family protein n=1 Tax=Mycobacterium sp. MYCO198283 TaxID=2883505 RepID=UPI001E52EEEF|nr:YihY/virulence factor BrkB family protein [Mycobacterium sp. MYCO198283]MCG5433879.1 YihY/virulence factor BrkB family protein [Mycobacterium sp. MYCO198283]